MADIKLGVYTICKNELQFVDKWMECMLEAGNSVVVPVIERLARNIRKVLG